MEGIQPATLPKHVAIIMDGNNDGPLRENFLEFQAIKKGLKGLERL